MEPCSVRLRQREELGVGGKPGSSWERQTPGCTGRLCSICWTMRRVTSCAAKMCSSLTMFFPAELGSWVQARPRGRVPSRGVNRASTLVAAKHFKMLISKTILLAQTPRRRRALGSRPRWGNKAVCSGDRCQGTSWSAWGRAGHAHTCSQPLSSSRGSRASPPSGTLGQLRKDTDKRRHGCSTFTVTRDV